MKEEKYGKLLECGEESSAGIVGVNKIMCSLKAVSLLRGVKEPFQQRLAKMHRKGRPGPLQAMINLSLRKLHAWAWLLARACTVRNSWSGHPVRLLALELLFCPHLWAQQCICFLFLIFYLRSTYMMTRFPSKYLVSHHSGEMNSFLQMISSREGLYLTLLGVVVCYQRRTNSVPFSDPVKWWNPRFSSSSFKGVKV